MLRDQLLPFFASRDESFVLKPPEPGRMCRLLAVNIQNPGAKRAERLIEWIVGEKSDILVVSELQSKPSCLNLISELRAQEYQCTLPDCTTKHGYHVVIASRITFKDLPVATPSLSGRVKVANFQDGTSSLYLVGVYGVTFNPRNAHLRRQYKADFEARVLQRFAGIPAGVAIIGDLNIVEPRFHGHIASQVAADQSHYARFVRCGFIDLLREKHPHSPEYTWYSPRDLKGQRLDHLFVSGRAKPWLSNVALRHDIRQDKLTDHGAIAVTLTFPSM